MRCCDLLMLGLTRSDNENRHNAYFTRQHTLIPIIHPARYMQAFYSAPHLRPPMALQYAVWTMASLGHDKYATYHDVFHRRCRHYLEEDELRVGINFLVFPPPPTPPLC